MSTKQSGGALFGVIIIMLVLIVGAIYIIVPRLSRQEIFVNPTATSTYSTTTLPTIVITATSSATSTQP